MTDSNDQAFIKVAIELRQVENAIATARLVKEVQLRIKVLEDQMANDYGKSRLEARSPACALKGVNLSQNCAEPMKKYVGFLEGLQGNFEDVDAYLTSSQNKLVELQKLVDLYTAGHDIVAAKLKGLE